MVLDRRKKLTLENPAAL